MASFPESTDLHSVPSSPSKLPGLARNVQVRCELDEDVSNPGRLDQHVQVLAIGCSGKASDPLCLPLGVLVES